LRDCFVRFFQEAPDWLVNVKLLTVFTAVFNYKKYVLNFTSIIRDISSIFQLALVP